MTQLDRFDIEILNLVQRDATLTADELAGRVSLSPSAIQRRLRRLRETGVIAARIDVVDTKAAGGRNVFVVAVQVERDHPGLMSQLRAWIAGSDHVQQAYYVTGEADLVLVVTAPDTETYDALMARMVVENPNIKRFTTSVALNVIKRGLFVPLEESGDTPTGP